MPTLQQIAVEAIRLLPGQPGDELLGRVITPSSFAATTVVSTSALIAAGLSEQTYAQKWVWRPGAASVADAVRYSISYAPATGTVTISSGSSDYSDTTVGSEVVILTPFSPESWRAAIDRAVRTTRFLDTTIVPFISGMPWHYIHELTWIDKPGHIREVGVTRSPVITRNRNFNKRNGVNTSGVFVPDHWTITNNADTSPYEATNYRTQKYRYSLERSGGTDATAVQTVSALRNGVSGDPPAGQTITAVVVGDPDTAGDILLSLTDGTTTSTSTGSGASLQEITATLTLAAAATEIAITITAQTSNAAQKLYEAYALVGELTDSVRRDNYPVYPLMQGDYEFEQGGPLKVRNPVIGAPGSFVVRSERPFPGFDETRLTSGAADADSTDAPLGTIAIGAVYYLLRGKYGGEASITKEWERKFDQARMAHLAAKTNGVGFQVLGPTLAQPALRVR